MQQFSDVKLCEWEIEKEADRIWYELRSAEFKVPGFGRVLFQRILKEFAEKIRGECQCGSPHSSSATSS